MIPQDVVERIINEVDIASVIKEYIPILPDGTGFKAVCPFHNDTNPSMKISTTKKIYKCFSCGAGGNVINFVMNYEKISYNEACVKLAKKIGIELQTYNDPNALAKQKMYKILEEASNFYSFYLENSIDSKDAIEYLNKRHINKEIIDTFKIGLAPNADNYLHQALNLKEFGIIDQIESGMVRKDRNDQVQDTFKSRIMFPLLNAQRQVVGFSGRIYLKNDNNPKYINSNENLVFHKSEILYNFANASEVARKENTIYVFEGFMDVIAAYKAGIKNGVATMGTALTKQHVKALTSVASKIILCFDGDSAGINATYKAANIFSTQNTIPYAVCLPDGLDPDEFQTKYGSQSLIDYLKANQKNVYEYIYENAKKDLIKEDVVSVQRFKEKVFGILKNTNYTIRDFYLNKLSAELEVDTSSLINDLNGSIVQPIKKTQLTKIVKKIPNKVYRALKVIIKHCLVKKSCFNEFYSEYLSNLSFSDFADYFEIFSKMAELYSYQDTIDVDILLALFNIESSVYTILQNIINEKINDTSSKQEFDQCIETIIEYQTNVHINAKKQKALDDDESINDYVNALKDLKMRK